MEAEELKKGLESLGSGILKKEWIDDAIECIEDLQSQLEKERAQKEITHSLWQEGVCPKCGVSMFDKFNAEIHNVKRCGNKKAVADNNECA